MKSKKRSFVAFLLFFTNLLLCTTKEENSPDWCGNKHKNLVILQDILKDDPYASVPPFLGISTGRVETFLKENNQNIFDAYHEYTQRVNKQSLLSLPFAIIKKFFNRKRFSYRNSTNQDLLVETQHNIEQIFDRVSFPFNQDEHDFFTSTEDDNTFLMVRSTGVEDNPNVANAGGNLSIAYVNPLLPTIQKAMGSVIASYFGEQSLKNRIAGGEVLSAHHHTLPVLIQQLVGEPKGGALDIEDIPVSGVAYTTNLNMSGKDFAITEIDATYGHGEGVVANKVVADRYFLTPSHINQDEVSIYPMIYEKRERLIPSLEDGSLIAVKNDNSLIHKSALSREQLLKLYTVLKKIERSYGKAMDVEFVVQKDKIYIVQARPAMHKPAHPSYFDFDKMDEHDATDPMSAITLVPGTGSLQIITNPRDVIVANTLDEADQKPNSFSAKVVIVNAWASSLSHPAVNFMSHGTPCLYVQNLFDIANKVMTISPSKPLIVDSQKGVICFWKNTKKSPHHFVVHGWFEHPIERTLSLFMDGPLPLLPSTAPVLPKDPQIINLAFKLKTTKHVNEQQSLLTMLNNRVETIFDLTEKRVKTTGYTINKQTEQAFNLFKKTYRSVITELFAAIQRNADHFEFLFYHKMLEALLYQLPEAQKVLGAYTYSSFLNEIFQKQLIQKILKTKKIVHTKELEYARFCPTQELSQKWIDFITLLDELSAMASPEFKERVLRFETLIHDLEESNALSLWLSTTFYQKASDAIIDHDFVSACIYNIANDYTQQAQEFLQNITIVQQDSAILKSQAGIGFTTPAAAQSKWKTIQQKLINPLTRQSFISDFKNASSPLQMIACNVMHECVDILDGTIKSVKTSSSIPMRNRIILFKEMLADFYGIFLAWINNIMPEYALSYNYSWPLSIYLAKMDQLYKNIISRSNRQSMFQRSASFSVNAAMLGTGTAFDRHYPKSAEDIFMLIHQNTLVAIAGAMKSLRGSIYLPPFLETCRVALASNEERRIYLIGITYTADTITLACNIPLNNHSGVCNLIYKTITNECLCEIQFIGQARNRWKQIAELARISPALSQLQLEDEVLFDKKAGIVSWRWIIEKESELPTIINYINVMCNRLSFEYDLTLNNLYDLYKGSGNRDTVIKKIMENYYKKYGERFVLDPHITNRIKKTVYQFLS